MTGLYVLKSQANLDGNFGDKFMVMEEVEFEKGSAKIKVPFNTIHFVFGAEKGKVVVKDNEAEIELKIVETKKVKLDIMIVGVKTVKG